jgi:hypothetical protein
LSSKNIKIGTHRIGTLLGAVCWCETQSVALRKAQRLFEKSVNNVRKNKKEKLYEIGRICKCFESGVTSPNIWDHHIKKYEMGEACGMHEGEKKGLQYFGRKSRRKRLL